MREFANRGRACHCGNTAFCTKSDLRESAVIGGGGKFKDVAADWILLAHAQGSVVQLSGMAGVLEVVQELGRIHALILTCYLGHDQKFRLNSLLVFGNEMTIPRSMLAAFVPGLSRSFTG